MPRTRVNREGTETASLRPSLGGITVLAIMVSPFDLNARADLIIALLRGMTMKKKRQKMVISPEQRERWVRNQQRLAERVAHHEAKLAEERAVRGDTA